LTQRGGRIIVIATRIIRFIMGSYGRKEGNMTSGQVSLAVNDTPIALDNFVQGYINHVVGGILASLKGTGVIGRVDLTIEGDQVSIVFNTAALPLNPFATRIIRNTLVGMISTLHGVHTIERMQVSIKR
jgi:hypothetical protein